MVFELIAAVVAGVAVGGLAMLLRKMIPAIPKFVTPAAAGAAMVAFGIYAEYAWYERTAAGLPDGISVVSSVADPSPLRPWTYAAPYVSRFSAVDVAGARRNDNAPGQVMVDLYFFARYTPIAKVPVLLDCKGGRRADIQDGVNFDADGAVVGAEWRPLPADDPLSKVVCATS